MASEKILQIMMSSNYLKNTSFERGDASDTTRAKEILNIIYQSNNIDTIFVNYFGSESVDEDSLYDLSEYLKTLNSTNNKLVDFGFEQRHIEKIKNVDRFMSSLQEFRYFIEFSSVDEMKSSEYLFNINNMNENPSLSYKLKLTEQNNDELYTMFENHFFKNISPENTDYFRLIYSPFMLKSESLNIETSKFYGSIITQIDFDTEHCNTYAENIGIDLYNNVINKCYRFFEPKYSIPLTDENLEHVLKYDGTVFARSDEYCSKCKFYRCDHQLLCYY